MTHEKTDILVIGAGIIGLSCAYELSKTGAKITVVDQSEPGMGCSYGNAGWITPCFALPLPMPGMFFKSIQWLLDPLSPLHIKPEPHLLLLKWLLRFLRSMNPETAHRSISALTEISKFSLNRYSELEAELGTSFGFERKGLLMVSQTRDGVQAALQEMKLVAEHGIPGQELNESEIKSREPALTGPLKGGVYFPAEAHLEPYLAVKALAQGCIKNGVKIISSTEVFQFEASQGKIKSVNTTRGKFEAQQYVLATGSWSNGLGRSLKLGLPILGGKGYSLIINQPQPSPKIPIMILDKKIAITPRKESIRIAGTLELVHQDYSINIRRVDAMIKGARENLNIPFPLKIIALWRGLRPCTPDGVPIIDFSKHYSNLFISAGHQMLGLQSAPGSARLACDLLLGKLPTFDPKPFSAQRF